MKKTTLIIVTLAGIIAALLYAGCADYGDESRENTPEPPPEEVLECEEPVVCEEPIKCEEWMPEECPEPEECEECEYCEQCPEPPKFDPCSCIDFTKKHHVTEEEEACLGSMIENHGLCGKFDLKVWCEDPNRPDHWKPLRAWVKGCKEVSPNN